MCTTCGCSTNENGITLTKMGEDHHTHIHEGHTHSHHHHENDLEHSHDHHGDHHHDHHHHEVSVVELEKDILSKNQLTAERNRGFFEALNIFALNLVSSPGSGKTTLLEKTIADLKNELSFSVIEGDQQTTNDAERIHALEVPVLQINTGKGCHLDAEMISKSVKQLKPAAHSVLMIENVGNLVCPAMFDLGENARAVIISVTEGEDKPLKYPDMFYTSHLCIINKTDLLPYLKFDIEQLKQNAVKVNPNIRFFEVSATTGEGMQEWYEYLKNNLNQQ
ncbi:hydrogenase nickel incorporation protein HypB [Daejeonia sp. YH14]|uniref:hydrogenase nickel incorporation protein HypB n=1 Tax=Daejeonia sp. YH14 TaxID=3439042 RepID=UPI003F495DE5